MTWRPLTWAWVRCASRLRWTLMEGWLHGLIWKSRTSIRSWMYVQHNHSVDECRLVYILHIGYWAVCFAVVGHSTGEDSWGVGGVYVEARGEHHRHPGSRGGPSGERAQGVSVLLKRANTFFYLIQSFFCVYSFIYAKEYEHKYKHIHYPPQHTIGVCLVSLCPSPYRHYVNEQCVLSCVEADLVLSA